jgi:hypothetical protein
MRDTTMLILHYKETFYKLFYMGDDSRQYLCVNILINASLGLGTRMPDNSE